MPLYGKHWLISLMDDIPIENQGEVKWTGCIPYLVALPIMWLLSRSLSLFVKYLVDMLFEKSNCLSQMMESFVCEMSLLVVPFVISKIKKDPIKIRKPNIDCKQFIIGVCALLLFSISSKPSLTTRSPYHCGWVYDGIIHCAIPAVFEEAIFRGWLLNSLSKYIPEVAAILLSSVCFALFHRFRQMEIYLTAAITSALWGVVDSKTKSIIPSIIAHFFHNLLHVILIDKWTVIKEMKNITRMICWLLGSFGLFWFLEMDYPSFS